MRIIELRACSVCEKRRSSVLARLRASIGRQTIMLNNAAALTVGAGTTAFLGFCYWWYAARMFSAEAVGYAAAAISVMNLLALISELGLGTLLIGELRKAREHASSLVSATLLISSGTAVVSGGVFLTLSGILSVDLGSITASPAHKVAFVIGLSITCFTLVLDQACVAMLRSTLQLSRTTAFAASKLLVLGLAGVCGTVGEFEIFATWIAGQFCSILVLWVICRHLKERVWYRPRVNLLRPMIGIVLRHHLLSIVIQAPGLILPFIVAVVLSPQINAAFYAAWTLVNVILLIPASLTSILYSVASHEPDSLTHRLKISLGLSAVFTVVAGFALLFSSEFILGLFNQIYPSMAGSSLGILGFGAIGVMVKYHYVVVQRIRYRMLAASVLLAILGALELVSAILGAHRGGLLGLTEYWLMAVALEAVVLSPVVFRAMRGDFVATNQTANTQTSARSANGASPVQHSKDIPCTV